MKRQLFHALLLLLACLTTGARELTVCTYNVRYKNSSDNSAGNGWDTRRTYLINFVNFQQPDLLGVQEAVQAQMTDMANGLTGYNYIGVGRDNGSTGGEYSAIFYRTERLVLLDHGDFWLSDTPYKPSKGFPASGGSTSFNRICTWGKFYDRLTGVVFFHFNTHLDLDETNRQQSYYLIKQKIEELASRQTPVIISGDYNAEQVGATYKLFLNSGFLYDCYDKAKQKFFPNGTCSGFNAGNYSTVSSELRRIDHIFVTRTAFNILHYAVLTPCYYSTSGTATYHERAYSDHNPVLAKLEFKSSVPTIELPSALPPSVDGVYQLSTAEELQAFSYMVNGVAGFAAEPAAKAIMLCDIDLAGRDTWLPIGSSDRPFTGSFDGQGHAVLGISIRTGKSCSGLFGKTKGATITSLRVSGSLTVGEGTTDHGVVGYADGSRISDITSELDITSSKANTDTRHIGGVVGSMWNGTQVAGCTFAGTLSDAGTDTAGGIVGYADGSDGSISACICCGTVRSAGSQTSTGGILGYVNSDAFRLSRCANVGTVGGAEGFTGQLVGRMMKVLATPPTQLFCVTGKGLAFGTGSAEGTDDCAEAVTEADVAGGRLTFLLNEGLTEEDIVFFQNLCDDGLTDPFPTVGTTPRHKRVYQGAQGRPTEQTDATDYAFFVNDGGRLPSLVLKDFFSTPVAFTADRAVFSREPAEAWGTVFLPFSASSTDEVQLYEVVPELTEETELAIAPCTMLGAYKPGLYNLTGSRLDLSASDAAIALPPAESSVTAGGFRLTGTLQDTTHSGGYVLSGNAFRRDEGEVLTHAFGAFLTTDSGQPQEVVLRICDADGITLAPASTGAETIFNLSGQRIDRAHATAKGIYIINSKKLVRK